MSTSSSSPSSSKLAHQQQPQQQQQPASPTSPSTPTKPTSASNSSPLQLSPDSTPPRQSPSPSSSTGTSSSSSPLTPTTARAANPATQRRVKLYVLKDTAWEDLGTGHCSSRFLEAPELRPSPERNDEVGLDEGPWIFVSKEAPPDPSKPDGTPPAQGENILRTKIQPYPPGYDEDDEDEDGGDNGEGSKVDDPMGYQRQQETLIVWTDQKTGLDMALSFATAAGCNEIWNFIRRGRRWAADQVAILSPSPSPSISSPPQAPFPLYPTQSTSLPEPTLGNIHSIDHTIRQLSRTVLGRERTAAAIFKGRYIEKLVKVHGEAEDLESLQDLHALCRVMQTIFLLNDSAIFDLVIRDDLILGVASILEYDPDFPTMKASYRAHLSDPTHFISVIPIHSTSLLTKIHQTHRLYYLKDVVLARILEDSTFSILNSAIYFNEVDIVNEVASDPQLLKDLFSIFDEKDTGEVTPPPKAETVPSESSPSIGPQLSESIGPQLPPEIAKLLGGVNSSAKSSTPASSSTPTPMQVDNPPAAAAAPAPSSPSTSTKLAAGSDKKHDAILFLQQFCSMAKNLQLPIRTQLFRSLADRGLLRVIEVALGRTATREDPLMRSATVEILMTLVDHDPSNVRSYSLKQHEKGDRPLAAFLVELFQSEEDLGLKAQMSEALRVLCDAGGEGGPLEAPPRLRQEDPEAEKFLQYFYDHCLHPLMQPILDLPKTGPDDPPLDLPVPDVALCAHLSELLCFFITHHSFRSKFFVLSTDISASVTNLFHARQKHLKLAAMRYLRACIGRVDEFYNRYLIKFDLIRPVLELADREKGKDNLVASACLEFFEYIRTTNQKSLLAHVNEVYPEKVKALAATVDTFALCIAKWEQNNEVRSRTGELSAGATSKPMTREGSFARMDVEEESYFNGSDDEDEGSAAKGTSKKREGGDAADGDRKRVKVDDASSTGALPRSKTWPMGGSGGKGLVDYGDDDDDDEDLLAGLSSGSAAKSGSEATSADEKKDGDSTKGDAEVPALPPSPEPDEYKPLPPMKRKAEDDDDELGLIASKGKKSAPSPKVGAKIGGGGSTTKASAGGPIKISFGAKLGGGGGAGAAKE